MTLHQANQGQQEIISQSHDILKKAFKKRFPSGQIIKNKNK